MKSIKFLLLLAVLFSVFTACKKDDDVVVSPGITGRWEGDWGFGNDVPTYDETWIIDEDGTVDILDENGGLYAQGTWDLVGTNYVMTYLSTSYNEYSIAGTYNESNLRISGTWGGSPSSTDGGKIEMTKKN